MITLSRISFLIIFTYRYSKKAEEEFIDFNNLQNAAARYGNLKYHFADFEKMPHN